MSPLSPADPPHADGSPSDDLRADDPLWTAIRDLWDAVDPPPADLAEGALARLATDQLDLEYELLTLVESTDRLAGVRGAVDSDHVWLLEYRSASCHVRLRIAASDEERRVDGWVVTDVPMAARIGGAEAGSGVREQRTTIDDHGRFEFVDTGAGQARIWLTPVEGPDERPVITPPFSI